jgi:aryl-alcohol dehydrogenase-like predicted oxidoreductase
MRYVRLGRTGLRVSELCLGAWNYGRETDEVSAWSLLDRFVEQGGNFIDTANAYHIGASEKIVGGWLKHGGQRDQLVLATKVYFPMGAGPNDLGLSRKHILRQIDESLTRLRTEYVDLYQVHCWDAGTELEETLSTLDGLVDAGKVRYIGASNYAGWQVMKALMLSRAHNWEPFATVQSEYSLLSRQVELEVLPVCRDSGLGVLCWGPLGGGWLTGKHKREDGRPVPGTRVADSTEPWHPESWESRNNERTWSVVAAVLEIARARGVTAAQVGLNWLRAQPDLPIPIFGARSMEQLNDNLGCVGWQLDPGEVRRLDEVSSLPPPYPYYFIERIGRMHARQPTQ